MTRKLTESYKKQLFLENKELLNVIYEFGGGIMLRQQLVILASKLLEVDEIKIDVQLSKLVKEGLIGQAKIFVNCKNKIIYINKYTMAQFSGKTSRDAWVPNQSTSNMLYYIFRTEFIIKYVLTNPKYLSEIRSAPLLINKNQSTKLYEWLSEKIEVTDSFHREFKFATEVIKRIPSNGEKRSDYFNLRTFSKNEFLFVDICKIKGEKTIQIIYLKINQASTKRFLKLMHCVFSMLIRYLGHEMVRIDLKILFFNDTEKNAFQKSLSKKRFIEYMEKKKFAMIAGHCNISLTSLELDKKYHLYRDL